MQRARSAPCGKFANVLVAWVPLLLATAGVLITFSAGLWNIGVEGQMTLGAIFTTWVLPPAAGHQPAARADHLPRHPRPGWSAARCGRRWPASLKIFGGVNEIFGGLGLNFVATALTI
ncbi:MAG: hypothetical protein M0C28_17350 [Candidatus Moduliflexus flocculans]|nr:hypothetical protein [Candidatus Moduliflexus flocculans]